MSCSEQRCHLHTSSYVGYPQSFFIIIIIFLFCGVFLVFVRRCCILGVRHEVVWPQIDSTFRKIFAKPGNADFWSDGILRISECRTKFGCTDPNAQIISGTIVSWTSQILATSLRMWLSLDIFIVNLLKARINFIVYSQSSSLLWFISNYQFIQPQFYCYCHGSTWPDFHRFHARLRNSFFLFLDYDPGIYFSYFFFFFAIFRHHPVVNVSNSGGFLFLIHRFLFTKSSLCSVFTFLFFYVSKRGWDLLKKLNSTFSKAITFNKWLNFT